MAIVVAGSMEMAAETLCSPTDAVTSAAVVVDSVVRASPASSVVTTWSPSEPAVRGEGDAHVG